MAWSRGLPAGVQESTPIVYRGVMYVIAPGASIQALDATNGDLIWEYERDYPTRTSCATVGAQQEPRHLRGHDLFRRAGRIPGRARCPDRQAALGNKGRQRTDHRRRIARRRWQGDLEPHLSAREARVLLHRRARRQDRQGGLEVLYVTAAPGEPGGDTWGDLPVDQRAAGPWGLPGSYDPVRKVVYWGVANPNPYTRFKRHGRYDANSLTSPSELYSNSTVALNVETGKLVWYFQELPGDDWDADHNQERILVRTRVSPDPRFVKWINPALRRGTEQDVVITVAEGGGMFAVAQETGQFLWARPFPFDDPNVNMSVIDVKTGRTRVNPDKLFKKDGDTILGCYHNTRGLWQIAYHPGKNSLYVPFHDQCLTMQADNSSATGYGPRNGILRPGSDPKKYMGIAKIDVATGEMQVIYSQPQPTNGSALTTGGNLVFFGDLNRRFRALDADTGKVLWESVVGGMIINSTITYAVNGKQYVMVFTGGAQSATSGPLGLDRQGHAARRVRTQRDLCFCVALETTIFHYDGTARH